MSSALAATELRGVHSGPRRRSIRTRFAVLCGAVLLAAGGVLLTVTLLVWQSRTGALTATPVPSGSTRSAIIGVSQYGADRHQLLIASLIALAVMTTVALVAGWLLAGRFVRPLRAIMATASEISATNLHARLNLGRADHELKELGDTLDQLLARLERSFTFERQFIANVSHELRTPIAAMRASLEVAMAKPGPVPVHIATLADRLGSELDDAERLLDGLLTLAHAQHAPLRDEAAVSLGSLARAALERRAGEVAAMGLRIQRAEGPDGWVSGNATLLARMVENVIANAIVHNQPGGWLRVTTAEQDACTRLVVENGGPTLDPGKVRSLTKPFARVGAPRTGLGKGAGLGLAIVASIAEVHGGELELRALDAGGLAVAITLPTAMASATGAAA